MAQLPKCRRHTLVTYATPDSDISLELRKEWMLEKLGKYLGQELEYGKEFTITIHEPIQWQIKSEAPFTDGLQLRFDLEEKGESPDDPSNKPVEM